MIDLDRLGCEAPRYRKLSHVRVTASSSAIKYPRGARGTRAGADGPLRPPRRENLLDRRARHPYTARVRWRSALRTQAKTTWTLRRAPRPSRKTRSS